MSSSSLEKKKSLDILSMNSIFQSALLFCGLQGAYSAHFMFMKSYSLAVKFKMCKTTISIFFFLIGGILKMLFTVIFPKGDTNLKCSPAFFEAMIVYAPSP